jgi:hypothetical protein
MPSIKSIIITGLIAVGFVILAKKLPVVKDWLA